MGPIAYAAYTLAVTIADSILLSMGCNIAIGK